VGFQLVGGRGADAQVLAMAAACASLFAG
jgi:Asp-tRNA(Asn)/Glu-tRNA(Gln) amidotransferase A subunit family amidase